VIDCSSQGTGYTKEVSEVMLNAYEAVRTNLTYNKLEVGELLFAEYTCPANVAKLESWSQMDCLVHVLSGRRTWHTTDGVWAAKHGDTLFFRKGASISEQFFDAEFCLLMFFIPDNIIKSTARELAASLNADTSRVEPIKSVVRVENDVALSAFFQSMRAYFAGKEKPSELLLRLKLKELIVSILTSGRNPALAAYFRSFINRDAPSVAEIMEANYRFNLSLEEFAQLCHRSLSSFKRDFGTHFKETPARWLLQKRLDHAAALFRGTKMNVTEIVFESGFQDVSHFSRVFKKRFGVAPSAYREAVPAAK